MSIFTGAGVAIVTPMKENGEVNFEKLGELLEEQIAGHTDAIIICGTTGESSTLTHEEHLEAIKYTVEKVNKRIPGLLQELVQTVQKLRFIYQKRQSAMVQTGCFW